MNVALVLPAIKPIEPVTAPPPCLTSLKVLEVTVEVSTASEKLAETFVLVATFVAPSSGEVDETNGATCNPNAVWVEL